MDNSTRLRRVLWSNFHGDILAGIPVYFNFSRYLISNLVASEFKLKSSEEGFNFFLEECRKLLEINGVKVHVKESAFTTDEDGFSSIINLIALQVVAAEFMSKGQGDYTSAAYFPPLRKLISPQLGTESVLPFEDDEYKKIWSVFKSEVLLIKSDAFITFDVVGRGANLNRIYPLSQALLNQRDLIALATTFYMQGRKLSLDKGEEFNWRSFLISNSRNLSLRGFFCATNEVMRPAVIEQLINFIQSFNIKEVLIMEEKIKESVNSFQVIIAENDDGFFTGDEPTIRHVFLGEHETEIEEFLGKTRLFTFFERKNYLTLRGNGGAWRGDPKINYEDRLDKLAFLSTSLDFLMYIETSIGIPNLSVATRPFESDQGYSLYYLTDKRCRDLTVSVVQGVIQSRRAEAKLIFYGGIQTDNRSNNYFAEYPPTFLTFNGRKILADEVFEVNSRRMTNKEFFEDLQAKREQSFSVSFQGERVSLSLRHADRNKKMVGTLIENGVISFKNKPVSLNDKAIVGFTFYNVDRLITVDRLDFLNFFIPETSFFDLMEKKEVEHLIESVMRSTEIGPAQKNYLSIYLRQTSLVPKRLAQKLKKSAA